ncbi:hypothetical protein ACH5RR_030676 [Cinchona calisaya]|uniref:Uncharacterized protein n=1 Tax=Cinchona calisaya TaxID=153742 RepID=A0ABD2YYT4_9GENT
MTAQAQKRRKKAASSLGESEAFVYSKDVSGTPLRTMKETSNAQVFSNHYLDGNSSSNITLTPTTIKLNDLDTINDNNEFDEVVDLEKTSDIVVSPLNEKGVNDLDTGPRSRELCRNMFMGRPLFGDLLAPKVRVNMCRTNTPFAGMPPEYSYLHRVKQHHSMIAPKSNWFSKAKHVSEKVLVKNPQMRMSERI